MHAPTTLMRCKGASPECYSVNYRGLRLTSSETVCPHTGLRAHQHANSGCNSSRSLGSVRCSSLFWGGDAARPARTRRPSAPARRGDSNPATNGPRNGPTRVRLQLAIAVPQPPPTFGRRHQLLQARLRRQVAEEILCRLGRVFRPLSPVSTRATAARQLPSGLATWLRKAHRVTAGVYTL